MKPETEEAVQAVCSRPKTSALAVTPVSHIDYSKVLTDFIQAKGLLTELVIVASLVRALTDSFGSASDLYQKLKRKSSPRDSDDEDRFHINMLGHRRRDSGFSMSSRSKDLCESEGELIFTSSAQIRAEYERGYGKIGESFARGDGKFHIDLMGYMLTRRSYGADPATITNHTTSEGASGHPPRPVYELVYRALVHPLAPCASDPDYTDSACSLDGGTEHAVSTHAAHALAFPKAARSAIQSALQSAWGFPRPRGYLAHDKTV